MTMNGKTVCRACGGNNLYCYLRLGNHPAANAFVRPERLSEPDIRHPLDTHVCLDCALIQIPNQLPPDFYLDYVYVPSASMTMPQHFRQLAHRFRQNLATSAGQLVVDIGCNDGLLLAACKDEGLEVLGVDPSANIAELARAKGVAVVNEYFTVDSARHIRNERGPAQIIVTTNTLNHIDDLHGFMQGVDTLLACGGAFVIEAPQALTCVELNEFDTVYHEHLSVFSATSIAAIARRIGLDIVDLEELPVHGGSMRYMIKRRSDAEPAVAAWMEQERRAGLFLRQTYDAHARRVERIRSDLLSVLTDLKLEGKKIAGYGAPAKGNTLLNYCAIGPDILDFIVDRNTMKQGRFTPGMRIPVVSPDRIATDKPEYLLILAWNFKDEIMEQQAAFRAQGGKFILPIPKVEIVD
jgi:SAM-dependent methyltransferase